ncbi:acyl-CoA dehydrogenase [Nocardioides mangrovicus]|uniref:Acyl-CoA dehydrogenase n=1 Tax=Nocardioides mangrovicus TaxID=2478913 RepID=A0A3L8NZX6_9ACTN|nr:acyl-CoA dehydrogenase family protein [Nocardioides mangrovicus]RLV48735.1 acyl-CoA dehydrogenase [Nocardioides mangrovicus]
MSLLDAARTQAQQLFSPGGRDGLSSAERRDPMGLLVYGLNRLAQTDLLDRVGLRKQTEDGVFKITSAGFKTIGATSRAFTRTGSSKKQGTRSAATRARGVFDLTPTDDEQMLVDVVTEFAEEVVRPAATGADDACAAPAELLAATLEIGLPILGVPESLGGIAEERTAMAGTLVHEALAHGDMGLAVAALAPGAVATALSLWGTEEQQQTYLPAFTGQSVPAAALALNEPTVLFDPARPATVATRTDDGFVLDGVKSMVPRGPDAELFVVGASLDGVPALFVVESTTPGIVIESEPSMGLRAASLSRLRLDRVEVGEIALLGRVDGSTHAEAVRLSRLAWCALAVGTGQAVLDYVTPYVKEREAFGEPIAHRQSVAFMVANIAIELQAMRLVTYKAAGRVAQGQDAGREIALARQLCATKGMQIGLDGVQLLGGHGFVKEHPVERWYRDLRAIGLTEGGVMV